MKTFILFLLSASLALAQWTAVPGTAYPALETILNAKPAVQFGAGAPTTQACTRGLDSYMDTANIAWYYCSVTGNPGSWVQMIAANGSFANPSFIATIPYSKITSPPSFGTFSLLNNPMTTAGDFLVGGAAGAPARLAAPSNGTFCPTWTSGVPSWIVCPGAGGGLSSVGLSPTSLGWLTISNSPLVANGNIGIAPATGQTSHQVVGTCGTATAVSLCPLVAGDIPSLSYQPPLTAYSTISALSGYPTLTNTVFGRSGTVTANSADYAGIYEPALGFPSTNGYVLSSTTAGVRSWIPEAAGGFVVLSTGSGVPSANCTAPSSTNLAVYLDTNSGDEWWCSATNTWKKLVSVTASGPLTLSGTAGAFSQGLAASLPACNAGAANTFYLATDTHALTACSNGGGSYVWSGTLNPTGQPACFLNGTTSPNSFVCVDPGGNVTNLRDASERSCDIAIGDASSSSAVTNAQLGPQKHVCRIPTSATILEVEIESDAGSPNAILGRRRCTAWTSGTCSTEAVVNLVSSALSASSGFEGCSNSGGTTGIDTGTTCFASLQNAGLNAGDWIELVSGTAGGTAKLVTAHVVYLVN